MDYSFNQQQRIFYIHYPTDRIVYTMTLVTPVIEHRLEQDVAQSIHNEVSHYERTLYHTDDNITIDKKVLVEYLNEMK